MATPVLVYQVLKLQASTIKNKPFLGRLMDENLASCYALETIRMKTRERIDNEFAAICKKLRK